MQVPGFLLRRLYVKGSLRNANGGFAFDLKNSLGSGYAEAMLALTLDGEELPPEASMFVIDGKGTPFGEVSAANPMSLAMNKSVTIEVGGKTLTPGKHKLGIGFVVSGMGALQFEVTDAIDGGSAEDDA
ncbi:MAG TPA: hydroxymethylglutaryl-CoA reductase [Dehalococcoidia bacterium]|nr:hydroxymethylglutaryl-CoA reductase [Dehalococcoidia bacterium]